MEVWVDAVGHSVFLVPLGHINEGQMSEAVYRLGRGAMAS